MRSTPKEAGVVLVEAALVVPLLFLFVLALLDLGLWVFASTQAAAAARDGARTAILHYKAADVPGTRDRATVEAAVTRQIDVSAPTVAVNCLRQDGSRVACAQAVPVEDRIEVSVSWERGSLALVGGLGPSPRRVSATSAMSITGRPGAHS